MVFIIFMMLVALLYATLLRSKHMIYLHHVQIKQKLIVQSKSVFSRIKMGEYEKIPKQQLSPITIQGLQNKLISLLNKSKIDNYEIKLEGSELVSKQCLFKLSINAKTQFKSILKLLSALRRDLFLWQDIEINHASENALEFRTVLLGFCGEFCVCENPL